MSDLTVRIVMLEPMRVARAHGFGESPEHRAWEKLIAWARPTGLLKDPEAHRIFGFNNPSPSPGSPNYGYDFWIVVGPEVEPTGDVEIVDFRGGLYAVARCQSVGNIGTVWQQLVDWREGSKYQHGGHQWLEEHIDLVEEPQDEEAMVLDLYLPIAE